MDSGILLALGECSERRLHDATFCFSLFGSALLMWFPLIATTASTYGAWVTWMDNLYGQFSLKACAWVIHCLHHSSIASTLCASSIFLILFAFENLSMSCSYLFWREQLSYTRLSVLFSMQSVRNDELFNVLLGWSCLCSTYILVLLALDWLHMWKAFFTGLESCGCGITTDRYFFFWACIPSFHCGTWYGLYFILNELSFFSIRYNLRAVSAKLVCTICSYITWVGPG